MSFAEKFQAGANIAKGLYNTYQDAKDQEDLDAINKSKQTDRAGFTAEDDAQRDAMSKAMKPDGTPYYTITPGDEKGGYGIKSNFQVDTSADKAPPQLQPAPDVQRDPGKVYSFMGKESDKALTDGQQNSARQMAAADVVSRRNPHLGLQMRSAANAEDRAEKSFALSNEASGLQIKSLRRADETATAEDDSQKDLTSFYQQSRIQPDGSLRDLTHDDIVAGNQRRALFLAGKGQIDAANKASDIATDSMVKLTIRQTTERNQALGPALAAMSNGDTAPLTSFYNKFFHDGYKVSSITTGSDGRLTIYRKGADGADVAPVRVTPAQIVQQSQVMSDPNQLVTQQQQAFSNQMAMRKADTDERRANALEMRAVGVGGTGSRGAGKAEVDPYGEALDTILSKGDLKLPTDQVATAQALVKRFSSMPGAFASPEEAAKVATDIAMNPGKVQPNLNLRDGTIDNYYSNGGKNIPVASNVMSFADLVKNKDSASVRAMATRLLGTMGAPEQQQALLVAIADPAQRAAILQGAEKRGGTPALEIMTRKLDILQTLAKPGGAEAATPKSAAGIFGSSTAPSASTAGSTALPANMTASDKQFAGVAAKNGWQFYVSSFGSNKDVAYRRPDGNGGWIVKSGADLAKQLNVMY